MNGCWWNLTEWRRAAQESGGQIFVQSDWNAELKFLNLDLSLRQGTSYMIRLICRLVIVSINSVFFSPAGSAILGSGLSLQIPSVFRRNLPRTRQRWKCVCTVLLPETSTFMHHLTKGLSFRHPDSLPSFLGRPLSCNFKVGLLSWLSSVCPSVTDVLWLNCAR